MGESDEVHDVSVSDDEMYISILFRFSCLMIIPVHKRHVAPSRGARTE